MNSSLDSAIFLDRDGTIIEDRGYISSVEDVVFIDGAIDALKLLQKYFKLFIITNQSGVSKGLLSNDDVDNINSYITNMLCNEQIYIEHVYVCPHQKHDNCDCIKPKEYFLNLTARNYGIDLSKSFSIGDHPCDVELAQNVGGKGLYLLTGHGLKHRNEISQTTAVFEDIKTASEWIIKNI